MSAPGATSEDPVVTPRTAGTSRSASASALWRDLAGGAAADPGFAWALGLGVVLISLGLLGFVPNPLVGAPSAAWGTPLLRTGDAHDVVHLVGGAIALHAALGLSRSRRDAVLIGLGAAALVLLAVGLLDGRWFGIAPWPVSLADQLLHLIVGLGSLLMGLAGSGTIVVPVVTGAYRRASMAERASTAEAAAAAKPGAAAEPVADTASAAELASSDASAGPASAAEGLPEPASDEVVPVEALPEPLGLVVEPDAAAASQPDATPDEPPTTPDEPPTTPDEPPTTPDEPPTTPDEPPTAPDEPATGPSSVADETLADHHSTVGEQDAPADAPGSDREPSASSEGTSSEP